ncbi:MAG: hypothetical protein RR478_05620 [Bacilli bacterium]
MARKFFNQKVHNTKKTIIQISVISGCVVGIIVCFFVANHFSNKSKPNQVVELRDSVAIEIKGDLPDKTIFFSELENVLEKDIKADFSKVNVNKVGEYPVTIKIGKKKYDLKLKIIDTESPILKVKNVKIENGKTYSAKDFVESCKDNSDESCNVSFYSLSINQDGVKIDYSKYKDEGVYTVQLIAKDSSDNSSAPVSATLTIGNKTDEEKPITPTICKYGNNLYDKSKYILGTYVTENNCAIDLNLYHDPKILASVNKIMDNETEKLKKEFSKLNVKGTITLNRNSEAVLNTVGYGVVGYTIHMDLIVTNNSKEELVESFFLDTTGKRIYSINKYNLN